jgi:hypothetical protein
MTDRAIAQWAEAAIDAIEKRQQHMIFRAGRGDGFDTALFDLYSQAKAGATLVTSSYSAMALYSSREGEEGGLCKS